MSSSTRDEAGARGLVESYIAASGALDATRLKGCFADKAALNGCLGPTLVAGDIGIYLADVERMAASETDMTGYAAEITALTTVGKIAAACVSMRGFAGASFQDLLHLVRDQDGWKIVAKTFSTLPPV